MCTSIRFNDAAGTMFFGRNLDWECGYGEVPVLAPKGWQYQWVFEDAAHHALYNENTYSGPHNVLGIGIVAENTPLYFDCMNEEGLAVAGLLFAGFAAYEQSPVEGKINIAAYELPLWICRNFSTLEQVEHALEKLAIVGKGIAGMEPSYLHWMVADKTGSLVIEYMADGIHVHRNTVDVLANQPSFDWHLENLRSYYMVSPEVPASCTWGNAELSAYGTGAGMRALPGDYYSSSRFVRAAYLNAHYPAVASEAENTTRLFRTLQGVAMIEGASRMKNGNFEKTIYTSGYSAATGSCYFSTYEDFTLQRCSFADFDMNGTQLVQKA